MNPELGQGWFRIAVFITLTSAVLLFFQQPGTAEFVITVTTLVIGLVFIAVVVIAVRWSSR
jgi:hypothetical protein